MAAQTFLVDGHLAMEEQADYALFGVPEVFSVT